MSEKEYWLERLNDYIDRVDYYDSDEISEEKRDQVVRSIINDDELRNFVENIMDYYLTHPPFKEYK